MSVKPRRLELIPPGEILRLEFMEPNGVSQNRLAPDLDVPVGRINEIVHDKRSITADTALRLARYFGTSAESGWRCKPITTCAEHGVSLEPRSRRGSERSRREADMRMRPQWKPGTILPP